MVATISVLDKDSSPVTVNTLPALGTALDAASLPVAFSTEGKAQIGSLTETAPASDTASSGVNGRLQRLAQRATSLIALFPTSLGAKAGSASLAVTTSIDDIKYVDVTLSLDTSAYAAGDLLADAQIVAACVKANDANGMLQSMVVLDEDDNGQPIDFYFANASSSFGTENAAPSITDANARTILGVVSVAAADYKDLGGVKMAFKGLIGMIVTPVASNDDIYVAAVLPSTATAATYTASGIRLRLGFMS